MKVKKIKDDKIVNNKNNFCSLFLLYVTTCKKCVPVKTVVTVVPAAILFLVLDTNNIFSCSISASSATWQTHRGILNLQGQHSLFHQCNSGEGNRTKLNAVYHSGNDLVLNRELSNDDGDGKEDVKKAIGLLRKTTTLHMHHSFLYIFLPPLHDYDVKMPNCKFYGGRKQATTNLFFSP